MDLRRREAIEATNQNLSSTDPKREPLPVKVPWQISHEDLAAADKELAAVLKETKLEATQYNLIELRDMLNDKVASALSEFYR
jgi:hypothetical protein